MMAILKAKKSEIMKDYAINDKDTGSAIVQTAILTERIKNLTEHMKANHKDFHSRRGLLVMVDKRRRLLNYLKNTNESQYKELIKRLKLRR